MIRLVIADDEAFVREGLRDAVDWKSMGVEVAGCVGDGYALCRCAVDSHADIALVDIRMPGLDGLTAIERLRSELPDCQCIIFTAYADFAYAKRALDMGVVGYITKPVLKQEVMEKVALAISRLPGRQADEAGTPIERIRRYVTEHLEEKSSLSSVASYMQMSPSYLSRYYKEKTGENFVDFSRSVRMERAKAYLRETNLKIYEIALRLGYQNAQHFAVAFKEYTGCTPVQYRTGEENHA